MEPLLSYETQGVVHLPGVLEPAFLSRLKSAFDRAAAKHAQNWLAAGDKGSSAMDIPAILDEDPVFVELADLPTIFPLLVGILGSDIQLLITAARLFRPCSTTFVPPWHSDLDTIQGVDLGHSLTFMAKIHFYPEDLTPEQGCLAFIPGSHRYPVGHPRPRVDYQHDSSLVRKIVPKAGDAVLFNPHIFHMCLDNRSPHVRKSLIYTYGHFWMKNYASAVPSNLDRAAPTAQRKQLFGVNTNTTGDYFNQILPGLGPSGQVYGPKGIGQKLLSAGRKLRRRVLAA